MTLFQELLAALATAQDRYLATDWPRLLQYHPERLHEAEAAREQLLLEALGQQGLTVGRREFQA